MTALRLHIADLLTITTGRLLCRDQPPIDGVYRTLNHMTGQSLFTHQLPDASRMAKPYLVEQFPWLAGLNPPEGADLPALLAWVERAAAEHGEWHDVRPMPPAAWGDPDPIAQLIERVGASQVIPIVINGEVPE